MALWLIAAHAQQRRPEVSFEATCSGTYADSQAALNPKIREFENGGTASYVRLIRTETTYETLFYGPDGTVRHRRTKSVVYGTGLAYMRRGEDVYFLTNMHVSTLPSVTGDAAKVDGVPAGAKKVSEESRLVQSDSDENYDKQVKLTRLVNDPLADASILRARSTKEIPLQVMPYKVGKAAELRVGNYVYVRGFPLGVFQAVNVGRVINPVDDDREQGWYHKDFIVDALLSAGNSGSPVFAVNCKASTLELVGMFHAAYHNGSALNAVVAIDEVRELMDTLRVPKRAQHASEQMLAAKDRERLLQEAKPGDLPLFPFAGGVAQIIAGANGITLAVLDRDFPASIARRVWVTDVPGPEFGTLVRVGFRDGAFAEHEIGTDKLEAGQLSAVGALYKALVTQLAATDDYRRVQSTLSVSQQNEHVRDLQRQKSQQRDVLETAVNALEDAIDTHDGPEALK